MSFYSNVFDSKLVMAQIVAMQALSYLSLSLLLWVVHELFASVPLHGMVIFNFRFLGSSASGHTNYVLACAFLVNSLCFGLELSLVVERAKKCLDFCVTYFLLHLALCTYAYGFPNEWRWWLVNALGLLASSLCGEYFCMKKELQEINVKEFLSMRPTTASTAANAGNAGNAVLANTSSSSSNRNLTTGSGSDQRRANAQKSEVTLASLV